jgi:hypothetical protein
MKKLQVFNKIIYIFCAATTFFICGVIVNAQSVTQGYAADEVLQKGMIVGLENDDLKKVEPINQEQYDRMHGVVVAQNDSAIYVNREGEKIYVATSGRYSVLVSDQNGVIESGDYITISSISGIGMKATKSNPIVLGPALEGFNGEDSNQVASVATIKDSNGEDYKINLGYVLVDINIAKNPLLETDNTLPGILRKASEMIAGKPVSSTRVYISLGVLAICTVISGSLIYSAVRSSMVAIGRNPLGKRSITKGLFQVVIICLMVFLVGVFGVYLLLRL